MIDIVPGKYENTVLKIGDRVQIINEEIRTYNDHPRFSQGGEIIELDSGDEWGYKVRFDDGIEDWVKRWHLEKM